MSVDGVGRATAAGGRGSPSPSLVSGEKALTEAELEVGCYSAYNQLLFLVYHYLGKYLITFDLIKCLFYLLGKAFAGRGGEENKNTALCFCSQVF